MSLNVGQFGNDTLSVDSVVHLINEIDPVIIALQEFGLYHKWPDIEVMSQDFSEKIGYSYYHFQPHEGNIFGTAIFSKFPIVSSELVYNQVSQTNEAWNHRIAVYQDTINIINAHLESFNLSRNDRLTFSEVLSKQNTQTSNILSAMLPEIRSILCGDFNAVPGTAVYSLMSEHYSDAMLSMGLGWVPTLKSLPIRIDHVFLSKCMQVHSLKVYSNTPSDHSAIFVQFD